ncbi:MAG: septal ring lytic transglycosylase RlpA family protein [Pseudomonadota bacterium]
MSQSVVSLRVVRLAALRASGLLLLGAGLAACGSASSGGAGSASSVQQRGAYKVGAPYKIDGVTYVPKESFNHVETGVASWYGPGFHGKSTANGERYDQRDRTAAHRTLQMPAIVRVTNLENGRSTVVRINDRGPFSRNRVIDLSRTAAEELDIVRNGTGRVRIDQLTAESLAVKEVALAGGGPAEQQTAVAQLASGARQAPAPQAAVQVASSPAPAAPPAVTAQPAATQVVAAQVVTTQAVWPGAPARPAPQEQQGLTVASLAAHGAPVASSLGSGGFYVQTGAFSTAQNAERQRDLIRSYGASEISHASAGGREIYRVRLGPYTTSDAAGIVADRLKRSGYGDARVVSD